MQNSQKQKTALRFVSQAGRDCFLPMEDPLQVSVLHCYFLAVVCFRGESLSSHHEPSCTLINRLCCCPSLLQEHHGFLTQKNILTTLSQRKKHAPAQHSLHLAFFWWKGRAACCMLAMISSLWFQGKLATLSWATPTKVLPHKHSSYSSTETYVVSEKGDCQIQPSRYVRYQKPRKEYGLLSKIPDSWGTHTVFHSTNSFFRVFFLTFIHETATRLAKVKPFSWLDAAGSWRGSSAVMLTNGWSSAHGGEIPTNYILRGHCAESIFTQGRLHHLFKTKQNKTINDRQVIASQFKSIEIWPFQVYIWWVAWNLWAEQKTQKHISLLLSSQTQYKNCWTVFV